MQEHDFNQNFKNFKKNLDLTEIDRKTLLDARKNIRSTIRIAFNENKEKHFSVNALQVLNGLIEDSNTTRPRFMTQGSYAYKTINTPNNPPTQQMDLDDGVYLPLSYVTSNNGSSNAIRKIIYNCVNDLCVTKGWQLEQKSKCLRITIDQSSHIDLPIYSIPDAEMKTIIESIAMDSIYSQTNISYPSTQNISLATNDDWIKSDPRVIQEWVEDTKNKYSNFTKYSRYIKAWRDHQYPNDDSDFSSLLIMASVDKALSEPGYQSNNNIALDLSNVVASISRYIAMGGIRSPANDGSMLDSDLKNRDILSQKLNTLSIPLNQATKNGEVYFLIDCFGKRFPDNSSKTIAKTVAPIIISSNTPMKPAVNF